MPVTPADRPEIHLARDADDVAADVIARFQTAIDTDPTKFRRAVQRLAAPALGSFVSLHKVTAEDRVAEDMVSHVFNSGYDKLTEFDEATEDSLAVNAIHKTLIDQLRKERNIASHEGEMKVVMRANPKAPEARDRVRWSRLSFFLLRVEEWHTAQSQQKRELPSAG